MKKSNFKTLLEIPMLHLPEKNKHVAFSREEQAINSKLKFQEIFHEALGNTTSNSGTKVSLWTSGFNLKFKPNFYLGEKKKDNHGKTYSRSNRRLQFLIQFAPLHSSPEELSLHSEQ